MARSIMRLLAVLAVLVAGAATALPAHAEAFRYWGYFTWDGTAWAFAQAGPADTAPADGSVEGWRFAVTDEQSTRLPRADGDFEALCGQTAAEDGSKRVGVVIDYGTAEDAPEGEAPPAARGTCVVVPPDASGADVMAAAAELRLGDGGFICGIDGYPAQGCGDPVDGAAPSADEQPVELALTAETSEGAGSSTAMIAIGAGAVALVATAAIVVARRRNPDDSAGA
jgi:hypothetical protein